MDPLDWAQQIGVLAAGFGSAFAAQWGYRRAIGPPEAGPPPLPPVSSPPTDQRLDELLARVDAVLARLDEMDTRHRQHEADAAAVRESLPTPEQQVERLLAQAKTADQAAKQTRALGELVAEVRALRDRLPPPGG